MSRPAIRRLISVPSPAALSPIRQRLAKAQQRLRDGELALEKCIEATARVEAVVDAAGPAEDAAKAAVNDAEWAAEQWASSGGARDDVPSKELARRQKAIEIATQAKQNAFEMRIKANGARASLPALKHAEYAAKLEIDSAGNEIASITLEMLLTELEPHFAIIEKARAQCVEANLEIHALSRAFFGKWYKFSSNTQSQKLLTRLKDLALREPSDDDLVERKRAWGRFGTRLATNPQAALTDAPESSE
jgi:hypothetical protein